MSKCDFADQKLQIVKQLNHYDETYKWQNNFTEMTIRYGCSIVNLDCAKSRSLHAFVPHVSHVPTCLTCLRAFASYVHSFFLLALTALTFYVPICLHFFIKCGTTHNQPQQAGRKSKNKPKIALTY